MSRFRPQHVVLIAILAAQAFLIGIFSLTDDPPALLAMLVGTLGSALALLDDARRPRARCVSAASGRRA